MSILLWVLLFTFFGSIVSMLGGILLLWKQKLMEGKILAMVAFAAGAMLAASFLDLIPEAIEKNKDFQNISAAVLTGIVIFFFLERFLVWYRHHGCPEGEECDAGLPTIPLLIFGDSLHNFLDGVVIGSSFLLSLPVGIVVSLAVFFHEIPHEMDNFSVLLFLKMSGRKVFLVNLLSAGFAFLGAVGAFYFLKEFAFLIPYLAAFAAGNFIYIAASDLIPQLHQTFERKIAFSQSAFFLLGILIIWLTTNLFV